MFQECLEKFLQGTGGLRNRELLMIHYLQQANYIPALQLNHSLRMSLAVRLTLPHTDSTNDESIKELNDSVFDSASSVLALALASASASAAVASYSFHMPSFRLDLLESTL